MRLMIFLLVCFLSFSGYSQSGPADLWSDVAEAPSFRLNDAENELISAVNNYRKKNKLDPIPVSASLSLVARLHVIDLSENYRYGSKCNLHSWSANPRWSSCCYTNDHRQASCMWDKPRELTGYPGDGYEIAFFSDEDYASASDFIEAALDGWKSSRGHHDLIVNRGKWDTASWKAMGVGVYNGFAVIWFGEVTDAKGVPAGYQP